MIAQMFDLHSGVPCCSMLSGIDRNDKADHGILAQYDGSASECEKKHEDVSPIDVVQVLINADGMGETNVTEPTTLFRLIDKEKWDAALQYLETGQFTDVGSFFGLGANNK